MNKFDLKNWDYSDEEHRILQLLMRRGKKQKAITIYTRALSMLKDEKSENPRNLFLRALKVIRPLLEVRAVRVAGSTYMVPIPVSEEKQKTYALRWLIESSRTRAEKSMEERLAHEVLDILSGKGKSIEKRDNLHRMAEGNQAFVHFRW